MNNLPLIPDSFARFIEKWASKKLPQADLTATLVRQRIYILPTRHGIGFCIILLLILAGAINYENSLAYLLTFLLTGVGFAGMIYTHQNLNHLDLHALTAEPVFAEQIAQFPIRITTNTGKQHYNICLQADNSDIVSSDLIFDNSETIIKIPVLATKRGLLKLGKIKVHTEFPLGLFYAWAWVELNIQCLVYPVPDPHPPMLYFSGGSTGDKLTETNGSDDFSNIRDYQKGDPLRQLAWKASARAGKLQSKVFNEESGKQIWLRWNDLPAGMDTEHRLSVLCRWALECEQKGITYGLEIPGNNIPPASGLHHRNEILMSLAMFHEL